MKLGNEKGFTLVEMMVIIVIIGILSAIALPNMSNVFSRNKLRTSTASVTSSLYLTRMKAINDGEQYGVEFYDDGSYQILRDPYGDGEVIGTPYYLDDEIAFSEITFNDWLVVFTPNGQLEKNCLPSGLYTGMIKITDSAMDSTTVEVTMISGRIRGTNR